MFVIQSGFRLVARSALVLAAAACASCAGPGNYVWYTELPRAPAAAKSDYFINTGDVVSIRVLNQESMATRVRVRQDGRISLPIIGDVDARGKRPSALRAELEGRLKDYLVAPSVTVNIEDAQPMSVSVLGEVARPGVYNVESNTGLAQVLALGGGPTEYASRDRIFVVRSQPAPMRIRFTYEALSRGENAAPAFPLHPGDVVVVE